VPIKTNATAIDATTVTRVAVDQPAALAQKPTTIPSITASKSGRALSFIARF
jgi:hypothetical protein